MSSDITIPVRNETENQKPSPSRNGNSRRRNRNRKTTNSTTSPKNTFPANSDTTSSTTVTVPVAGILHLTGNTAILRTRGYSPHPHDVTVEMNLIHRYRLRSGDAITGTATVTVNEPDGKKEKKHERLTAVATVNSIAVEQMKPRPDFDQLTPLYPQERLKLETAPNNYIGRVIDLVAPIGKGQRALIAAPPRTGKTMILQAIAHAITTNHPEAHLMVILVDERPEEVTDMQRSVHGEVIASTFDRPAREHTMLAELAMERAKRLVELGMDVVILLDSMTRLGRAYNLAAPASGRILSGGVDSTALQAPKKFFGAARNIEHGGSLTIISTALIETGSRMDEVIFEEFKGTGNMEVRLDRWLADKRLYPAVNITLSGTRKEELLLSTEELAIVWKLRRALHALEPQPALELLLAKLQETKTNTEFLRQIQGTTLG